MQDIHPMFLFACLSRVNDVQIKQSPPLKVGGYLCFCGDCEAAACVFAAFLCNSRERLKLSGVCVAASDATAGLDGGAHAVGGGGVTFNTR